MAIKGLGRLSFLLTLALAQAQGNNKTPTLDPDAIQSGSFTDGSAALGAEAFQAASLTSENNFINFCAGKTLTNGFQITDGSCNGIVMGQIPSKDTMTSVVITSPKNGDSIGSGEDFTITVQVDNLEAGAFTNAVASYYAAPQQLKGGRIVGHIHVTVQDTGANLNPTKPLDATKFAFFKGINDVGDGSGGLSADVAGGLPAGNYRLCTLVSAANHQPVIMPVAQRGAQDDCIRFEVTGNGKTKNIAANDGEKGVAAAAQAAEAITLGPGAPDPGGNNEDETDAGGNGGGNTSNAASASAASKTASGASETASAAATDETGAAADETASSTESADAATTPEAGGKGKGKGKGNEKAKRSMRLARLSRQRHFVA
ncbi:hypothetical protein BT67DRAFT_235294 [Trichocladium antarcticum]|uniref:Ribosomal protein s17 n=1 Tax=Trichocladium antarcticum TaxID=1450529 RepID=A0AAN6UQV0_9PEZI|nr:hypothetical protein BT67DRAFT_235294 [Trichocladium antarcticum]